MWTALAAAAVPIIKEFNALQLASMAWACGNITFRDERLEEVLAAQCISHLRNFGPRELTATAWALAARPKIHAPLLGALVT